MCVRYMVGRCPNSSLVCPFLHDKNEAALCQRWRQGCCPMNNMCNMRHFYLEKDAWLTRERAPFREVSNTTSSYSSPLVVKVKKLTETHRKEEVDLETGKRRSWIETTTKDLIDITGEASPMTSRNKPDEERTVYVPDDTLVEADDTLTVSRPVKDTVAEEEANKRREMDMREKSKQMTESGWCKVCTRKFRGVRGLNTHLAKSKCGREVDESIVCVN